MGSHEPGENEKINETTKFAKNRREINCQWKMNNKNVCYLRCEQCSSVYASCSKQRRTNLIRIVKYLHILVFAKISDMRIERHCGREKRDATIQPIYRNICYEKPHVINHRYVNDTSTSIEFIWYCQANVEHSTILPMCSYT